MALVTHNVIPSDGQGRVCYELVRYLCGAGHQVHVYANRVDPGLPQWAGVTWHRVPVWLEKPNLLKCIEFMVRATFMLMGHRYGVVHVNGAVALVRHHVNTAHFVHRAWLAGGFREVPGLRGSYHRLYRHVNSWLEAVVFRRACRIVAVSPKVSTEILSSVSLPAERVQCINNGCDTPQPPLAPHTRQELRQQLWPGLSPDDLLVGFAGDIVTTRKGVDTVIRAMVRLRGEPVRLVVAGATQSSPYPATVTELGLESQVRFLGFRRDLSRVFQALDCFVFPTRYDTFGLVATEAAAAGSPLLLSNPTFCGAAGLFRDGDSALFIHDPADDREVAEGLLHLLRNPVERRRLGAAAQGTAAGWTWEQMGQAYVNLYRTVLKGEG